MQLVRKTFFLIYIHWKYHVSIVTLLRNLYIGQFEAEVFYKSHFIIDSECSGKTFLVIRD